MQEDVEKVVEKLTKRQAYYGGYMMGLKEFAETILEAKQGTGRKMLSIDFIANDLIPSLIDVVREQCREECANEHKTCN